MWERVLGANGLFGYALNTTAVSILGKRLGKPKVKSVIWECTLVNMLDPAVLILSLAAVPSICGIPTLPTLEPRDCCSSCRVCCGAYPWPLNTVTWSISRANFICRTCRLGCQVSGRKRASDFQKKLTIATFALRAIHGGVRRATPFS